MVLKCATLHCPGLYDFLGRGNIISLHDHHKVICDMYVVLSLYGIVEPQAAQSPCVIAVKKVLYLVPCIVLSLLCKFGADQASCSSGRGADRRDKTTQGAR